MTKEIDVFISYAHEDEKYKDELIKHLSILRRRGIISTWHDRDITAGSDLNEQILLHLESATIVLLLISADFISSDYCFNVEMKHAFKRYKSGLTRVVSIILRPVSGWKSLDIGKFLVLPTDAKPVSKWHDQDEAFSDIAEGIQNLIEEMGLQNEVTQLSENTFLNGDWKTYINGRYGFSIQVPKEWEIGSESDNGDGVELYLGNPLIDIRAYASHYFQDFSSPYDKVGVPGYRMQRLYLNNGLEAELIIGKVDNNVYLNMLQIIDEIEYHFYALVSSEFFTQNETSLLNVIKSFDALLEGIDN